MKKVILIFITQFLLLTTVAQVLDTSTVLRSSEKTEIQYMEKAGSCASPDGPMQITASPPGSHAYLQANGYCYSGIPTTSTVTMCFTFVTTTTSVSLNAGFSTSCGNNSFTSFNLYNSSCTFVTSSLTPTGLVIGQQYTWCVTMRAWGGAFCNGYDTFCPYWMSIYNLAVNIRDFSTDCKTIKWETVSESNSDEYVIEGSKDGYTWTAQAKIKSKNSSIGGTYFVTVTDRSNKYYKISSYDFDGVITDTKTIPASCGEKTVEYYYDASGRFLGKAVPTTSGTYYILDASGHFTKVIL